jgi:hypothetical protein
MSLFQGLFSAPQSQASTLFSEENKFRRQQSAAAPLIAPKEVAAEPSKKKKRKVDVEIGQLPDRVPELKVWDMIQVPARPATLSGAPSKGSIGRK